MHPIDEAITETRDGPVLTIEVSPGSKQERFPAGYNPWRKAIGCRVSAPALEGRANAAVVSLIAESLNIPRAAVSIRSGAASSIKKVLIQGQTKNGLAGELASLL